MRRIKEEGRTPVTVDQWSGPVEGLYEDGNRGAPELRGDPAPSSSAAEKASTKEPGASPNGSGTGKPTGVRLVRRSTLPHRRHRRYRRHLATKRARTFVTTKIVAKRPAAANKTPATAKVSLVRRVNLVRRVPKRRRISLRKRPAQQPEKWRAFAPVPEDRPGPITRVLRAVGRGVLHEYTLASLGSLLLAVIMTWPTMRHPTRTIPQDLGDPLLQAWQLAWSGHALGSDPGSIWNSNAFFPEKLSFAFSDTLLGFAPLGLLGNGVSAAILRYNIVFTLAFALAFFGAYMLVRQLGAARSGAVVAAAAFAYAPWRWGQAGHLHVLSSGGIVLALAMLARGHGFSLRHGYRPSDAKPAWALGGWLVAAWQISLGFGIGLPFAYLLALLVVVAVIAWLVVPRHRIPGFSSAAPTPAPTLSPNTHPATERSPYARPVPEAPADAASASDTSAYARPTSQTSPYARAGAITSAVPQPTTARPPRRGAPSEPDLDVTVIDFGPARPEPAQPARPSRPAGPLGRWLNRRPPFARLLLGADVLGGLIFAAVGAVMAIPYLRVVDEHPYARRSVEELDIYSPPAYGFLTSPAESWLWGHGHSGLRATLTFPPEGALLVGFVLLGLALAGLLYSVWSYQVRFVLLVAMIVSTVLAMGTATPFEGEFTYLPLYEWLPGWDAIRTPGRLVLYTTLFAGILAAGAVSAFVERAREFTIERGSGPYPGPFLRLALLLPMVLVLVEGISASPHPEVPRPPAGLSTAEPPVLVLPSDQLSDMMVMLWSTDGFPAVVNGGSGFVPARLAEVRQVAEGFPDAASIRLLQDLGVRTVVVVKSTVAGTPYAAAAEPDAFGLDIEVEDTPELVIYHLEPTQG